MVVGILQVEISIAWAESLKDKRRIVRSLKDRLHREHQVSVAEVATQDNHRVATLGIVMAACQVAQTQRTLDNIVNKITDTRDCVLDNHAIEILSGY